METDNPRSNLFNMMSVFYKQNRFTMTSQERRGV